MSKIKTRPESHEFFPWLRLVLQIYFKCAIKEQVAPIIITKWFFWVNNAFDWNNTI